jgi:glutathione S-transferase
MGNVAGKPSSDSQEYFLIPRTPELKSLRTEQLSLVLQVHRPPPRKKIPSAIDHNKNEIQRILGVLNTALEGKDCLVGDKCTFADLSFLPWNCRPNALLQTPPEVDLLEAFSNVQKWHQGMVSRDAWKRAMETRNRLIDEQGLQSNGMPKGITNIKEYEELVAKHAAAAAAEAA